jgi:regulator of protease activity HflC (stomatin/prohibitin superfamily)
MTSHWPDRNHRSVQGLEKLVTWLTLFVLLVLYWGYAWIFERIDYFAAPPGWWMSVVNRYPLLDLIEPAVLLAAEFLSIRVLRHFIPIVLAALLARTAVHRFLASFYDLPDQNSAKGLLKRLRAWRIPDKPVAKLDADNFTHAQTNNTVLKVGGPAKVEVERGSAIVTEVNGRYARVLGPGVRYLARFERPFAIIDLRPQDRHTDESTMMTRDGIEITASVGVTFHIESNDQLPSHDVPFPFDRSAVRKAAYAQTITGDGNVIGWKPISLGVATGQLAEIVGESWLDELAHPTQGGVQPYPSRNREMRRATRAIMKDQGVTITDTRLGRLELPEAVRVKYLELWRVYWEKKRRLDEAEGEAALIEEKEIARARANALMFMAILEGLQRARTMAGDESSTRIVALRLIEALQTMARRSQEESPAPEYILGTLSELQKQLLEDGQGEEPV